ncbi:vitamin K epoxide reductase family protein [Nocardioides seonyuensis]|uniref:Vitamin K epoxide reductase family protein n=1 Tax=Nocardioides seonyuensis TaxID=2518371 RepID=A0A4P7IK92_9ACTN|nr:vitamin K epoxide reductase family protein [Nocardioides seonyuensis]QBX57263.1 vitamin K epoxide reductase family protein [Nocardioides seonyuensis]
MTPDRRLSAGLVVGGLAGLVASAVLLIERINLAQDSDYVPSCSINPIISCGSVMESAQASLLGFPNPLIGVAAFPIVVATGAALLAGGRLARWYWLGLQAGVSAALALVMWLAFQSLYRIGALCPYCMVVWAVVIPLFWYVTLHNLKSGAFGEAAASSRVTAAVRAWHAPLLLAAYLLVLVLITIQFWAYWSTLL